MAELPGGSVEPGMPLGIVTPDSSDAVPADPLGAVALVAQRRQPSSMCATPRVCTTTSICARSTDSDVNARWCWISSMLAPGAEQHRHVGDAPGTSRRSRRSRASRPERTMPRWMISASTSGSMLPPHRSGRPLRPAKVRGASSAPPDRPRLRPRRRSSRSRAASGCRARCRPRRRATQHVVDALPDQWQRGTPGDLTPMPSAIVARAARLLPPWTAFQTAGKRSVRTPTMRMPGATAWRRWPRR